MGGGSVCGMRVFNYPIAMAPLERLKVSIECYHRIDTSDLRPFGINHHSPLGRRRGRRGGADYATGNSSVPNVILVCMGPL